MKPSTPPLVRLQLAAYNLLMAAATPLLRRKLHRRAVAEPLYGQRIEERFGQYTTSPHATAPQPNAPRTAVVPNPTALVTQPSTQPVKPSPSADAPRVWIHAVSLGETQAAKILIDTLRLQMPKMQLILTHGTATGRAAGAALLRSGDTQVWQPWDTPSAVARFLDHHQPHITLLLETEVWPNLLLQSKARDIPVLLINARMSDKTLRQTLRFSHLAKHVYGHLTHILPQSAEDGARFLQLSPAARVHAPLGNIKFDVRLDPAQLDLGHTHRQTAQRPIIMMASSREGEEAQLLAALQNMKQAGHATAHSSSNLSPQPLPKAQWLIVPRHPQRFDAVAALIESHGLTVLRRSIYADPSQWLAAAATATPTTVLLGDSVGEMALYYGAASVCLLGGSFADLGGQNLIEAAAASCPVVMGPSTFNFAQAAALALACDAAIQVDDMAHAVQTAVRCVADSSDLAKRQAAAWAFSQAHQGASVHTAALILAALQAR